jgi:hypothetical protein
VLKNRHVNRRVAKQIGTAAESAASRVLSLHPEVRGREEEITSQLRSEITLRMIESVRDSLDGVEINDVRFDVYTFRKKEEKRVGADLLGVVQYRLGDDRVTKIYLAQAKVARAIVRGNRTAAVFYDSRVRGQAVRMTRRVAAASFVLVYTSSGIFSVPASEIAISQSNRFDTDSLSYRRFGPFYEEFFACFIGEHIKVDEPLDQAGLARLAQELEADQALGVGVSFRV